MSESPSPTVDQLQAWIRRLDYASLSTREVCELEEAHDWGYDYGEPFPGKWDTPGLTRSILAEVLEYRELKAGMWALEQTPADTDRPTSSLVSLGDGLYRVTGVQWDASGKYRTDGNRFIREGKGDVE